jgi:hypothetical protein
MALLSSGVQRTIPFDRADTRINCVHVSPAIVRRNSEHEFLQRAARTDRR